jgi:hypothetical protein
LQPSVSDEYGAMLSNEVARGDWIVDPESGDALNSKGQTIADHLEFTLSTRPHWLMPVVLEDEAEAVWTSGNLTKQGARLKQLEAFAGSKAAALVLLTEEAARYGVKPFTTQVGTKPGSDATTIDEAKKIVADEGANNPFNPKKVYPGGDQSRLNEIQKFIVRFGAAASARSAAKFGVDLAGRALRKRA